MHLTLFNGSPRGKSSNTKILLERLVEGFSTYKGNTNEVHYLIFQKDMESFVEAFSRAENVILAFPLYTDAMPGIVKLFIERLQPFIGREGNPGLGFIVQSGFPETIHSRFVERYLEKLARRLGCKYLGTVIKGGIEGIQARPNWMNRKVFRRFRCLGKRLAKSGRFNPRLIRRLAGRRERLSGFSIKMYNLLRKTGMFDSYWNNMLRENKAFNDRYARPYRDS